MATMNRRELLRYFLPVAAAAPLALKAAFEDKALILPPPIEIAERCSVVSPRSRCVNFCAPGRNVCAAHDERITVRMIRAYDPVRDLMVTRFDALYGELPRPRTVEHVAVVELAHGQCVTFAPLYYDYMVDPIDSRDRVARLRLASA
jgi:hypothetical protein